MLKSWKRSVWQLNSSLYNSSNEFNRFQAIVPFLFLLKISEDIWFSNVFRERGEGVKREHQLEMGYFCIEILSTENVPENVLQLRINQRIWLVKSVFDVCSSVANTIKVMLVIKRFGIIVEIIIIVRMILERNFLLWYISVSVIAPFLFSFPPKLDSTTRQSIFHFFSQLNLKPNPF